MSNQNFFYTLLLGSKRQASGPCSTKICGVTFEGYGYLYNWWAIYGAGPQTNGGRDIGGIVNASQPYTDERNQWRVPSVQDWTDLANALGGSSVAGGKLKTTCTAPFTTDNGVWFNPNNGATNEVNWAAVPGGLRDFSGSFNNFRNIGYWWSSTEVPPDSASFYNILHFQLSLNQINTFKDSGFSLRLVRPATTSEQALPDGTTSNSNPSLPHYIGNTRAYITTKVGNQVWTAQNLVEEKYNNGTLIPEVTVNSTWGALTTGARCRYFNGVFSITSGVIDLCGQANVSPYCCAPEIDVSEAGSGPGVVVSWSLPGSDFCSSCANIQIESSLDEITWAIDVFPCNSSPVQIFDAGCPSAWRAKILCSNGSESVYSPTVYCTPSFGP